MTFPTYDFKFFTTLDSAVCKSDSANSALRLYENCTVALPAKLFNYQHRNTTTSFRICPEIIWRHLFLFLCTSLVLFLLFLSGQEHAHIHCLFLFFFSMRSTPQSMHKGCAFANAAATASMCFGRSTCSLARFRS